MLKILAIVTAVCAIGYYMNQDYNDAMAKCQIKHSFDTCFHSLNR
jgi:hypothetical protein